MIMYVNGDSHTAGLGIEKEETFAHHIAQHYGAEYINEAKSGGSNDRILRLTNTYLDNHKPDFVLIGWSSWEREEWLYEGRYYDVNSSGHDRMPTVLQERYKDWMAIGQSTNEEIQDKMRDQHDRMFQLHQRLQNENIPHLFFNCVLSLWLINNQQNWGVNYIEPYSGVHYNTNPGCMHLYLHKQGFVPPLLFGNHHGPDANRAWSTRLIDYITQHSIL